MRFFRRLVISMSYALVLTPTPAISADVMDSVTQKWSFECPADTLPRELTGTRDFNVLYQDLATTAIREGLAALEPINPKLFQVAVSRIKTGYPIKFICTFTPGTEGYNAFFTPSTLITSGDYETITITKSWIETLKKSLGGDHEKSVEILATLFHEYLHYLRFDNLSVEQHKRSPFIQPNFWPQEVNKDVIVACTAQAYPNRSRIVEVRRKAEPEGKATHEAMSRSFGSCEICARAIPKANGGTTLEYGALGMYEAQTRCSGTNEELLSDLAKFHSGGWAVLPTSARRDK